MNFVITAGPTIEPLDQVRRLTNFSTGRLGTELARYLSQRGHTVTLLLSEQAVYQRALPNVEVMPFTSTATLREELKELSKVTVTAVFHASAVCDFTFGKVWRVRSDGTRVPVEEGKISTRGGRLLAELVPTPKLIAELRDLFPDSWVVGWKYEVEGDRNEVIASAEAQIEECRTSACVANGPAYGEGFGIVLPDKRLLHLENAEALYEELYNMITF